MSVALVALGGCGRVAFDPRIDAGAGSDAVSDSSIDAAWAGPVFRGGATRPQTTAAMANSTILPTGIVSTDVLVVAVGWASAVANVTSLSDSNGDTFVAVTPLQRGGAFSQVMYLAITPATSAPGDTITVNFNQSVTSTLRLGQYGNAQETTVVPTASAGGTSTTASVFVTTDAPETLIVGGITCTLAVTAGASYTLDIPTTPAFDIIESMRATDVGSYDVDGTFQINSDWVVQAIALRPQ